MIKSLKIIGSLIALTIVFLIVACGSNNTNGNDSDVDRAHVDGIDNTIIEAYIYEISKIDLEGIPYYIEGAIAYNEQIVFWYVDKEQTIVVVFVEEDGSIVHETRIPVQRDVYVGGLQITDDGNIELVKVIGAGYIELPAGLAARATVVVRFPTT